MSSSKDVIILTGFGPFKEHIVNASWETVKEVSRTEIEKELDIKLIIEEIPVVYNVVAEKIPALWKEHKPILVIHVGVSSIASGLTIEKQAHNQGYKSIDNENNVPCNQCCIPDGGEMIKCQLDVAALCRAVNQLGIELTSQSSDFAGRYLCEFCYYVSLSINCQRCLFVHVPTLEKGIPVSLLAKGLVTVLREALAQVKCKDKK